MSFKMECFVRAIMRETEDVARVDVEPTDRFKITRKNPVSGNPPTEYALFVDVNYFQEVIDEGAARVVKLVDGKFGLRLGLHNRTFDYTCLAASQACRSRVRILVDEEVKNIESVEMVR